MRRGIGIKKNIWYSLELLNEAIRIDNHPVAMYIIVHKYTYEDIKEKDFDKMIGMEIF